MKVVSLDSLKESPDQLFGWFGRGRRFLTEVRSELGRVTWPNRREVWATTIVVILTSLVFGLYLYGVDLVLSRIVGSIIERFGG
jgi:preprotein translocase subunit SecE